MDESQRAALKAAAAACGIHLTDERLEVLLGSAQRVDRVLETLAAIPYGAVEPAARFRPAPGPRTS